MKTDLSTEAAQRILLYAKKLTQKYKQNEFFTRESLFKAMRFLEEERKRENALPEREE